MRGQTKKVRNNEKMNKTEEERRKGRKKEREE
jgi:hypothetical protein